MNEIIDKKHITTFTPCHHIVEIAEPLSKIENSPSHEFETQEMNINHILSNNLQVRENRNLKTMAFIPESIQETVFDSIAQRQFEKELNELKQNKKFELDYSSVPDNTFNP